jgi:hypothetical protein
MDSPTVMFADDNSTYRRAARRKQQEERRKKVRRASIMATLRRLKDEAEDPGLLAAKDRERRHQEMLERYPPLY